MPTEKKQKNQQRRRPFWRRTDSDMHINLGGGSLISSDITLTAAQANNAVKLLLAKSQRPARMIGADSKPAVKL